MRLSTIIIIQFSILSSCWMNRTTDELHVPIVYYNDSTAVVLDSLVIQSIEVDRGEISLNYRVNFLGGYVKPLGAGDLHKTFSESVIVGDQIIFDLDVNRITINKIDGQTEVFRKNSL